MKRAIGRQLSYICFVLLLSAPAGLADTDPPVNSQSSFQPLSPQEKFDYYVQHTFAMGDVLETSALAGIAQWRDSPLEWGVGRIRTSVGLKLWSIFHQEPHSRKIRGTSLPRKMGFGGVPHTLLLKR